MGHDGDMQRMLARSRNDGCGDATVSFEICALMPALNVKMAFAAWQEGTLLLLTTPPPPHACPADLDQRT